MMTDNEVQNGQEYTYKGNAYIVINCENMLVKDSNDSNWYPALTYRWSDGDMSMIFCRRLDDFQAKFKPTPSA